MARGGARLGAGRKPQAMYVVPQGAAASTTGGEVIKGEPIPPPEHLSEAKRAVWERFAPQAHAIGTLIPGKEGGFELLCDVTAKYEAIERIIDTEGWTYLKVTIDGAGQEHQEQKRHTLWPQLAIFAVRRQQALKEFCLTANGRPSSSGAPVANPWSTI